MTDTVYDPSDVMQLRYMFSMSVSFTRDFHLTIATVSSAACNLFTKSDLLVTLHSSVKSSYRTRMWGNAQRDGRPAEHRWRLCSTPQSLADAHYLTASQ